MLIATGASPRVLPNAEPDGERILNWRQLYDLDRAARAPGRRRVRRHRRRVRATPTPSSGVTVTVVASRDQILPHEDSDAAAVLEEVFAERGVTLVKNARAESVTRTDDGVRGDAGRRPHRRGQPRADDRRLGAQHQRPGPGAGRHRARAGRLPAGGPGVAHHGVRASTRPATAPGCCRWPRWPPCRAASRCTTRWARGSRRSGCARWPPRCSPGRRSPPSACRRPTIDDGTVPARTLMLPLTTNARAKMSLPAPRLRQDLLPAGHRRGDRRRGGGADRLGADPADRAGGAERHHGRRIWRRRLSVYPSLSGSITEAAPAADGARRSGLSCRVALRSMTDQ